MFTRLTSSSDLSAAAARALAQVLRDRKDLEWANWLTDLRSKFPKPAGPAAAFFKGLGAILVATVVIPSGVVVVIGAGGAIAAAGGAAALAGAWAGTAAASGGVAMVGTGLLVVAGG
jgi:hypothetical protein